MGCSTCGTGGCSSNGGCKNSGLCASGSCNKMNAYDWISTMDLEDPSAYQYVEVSFKNGARKEFFKNPVHCVTGDDVLVEIQGGGYDIGVISLSGELVRIQMKKKHVQEDRITSNIIRKANERDLEKLQNKVQFEYDSMVKARAIARSIGLEIKIGDVEYQGDLKKATFFFTANGRVDFRELVRLYAKEFKVKIEMRQIGSRQESARIGGIGSCGRELCCSTWLSDFKSVNTTAARYQNIAINQTKLSGQCGRLKCCLNYELDSYADALQHFPTHANVLMTKKGRANLVKTDIFKGLMYYAYEDIAMRGVFHPIDKEKVKEILDLNRKNIQPEDLVNYTEVKEESKEIEFADVTGEIELSNKKKKKKKKPQGRDRVPGAQPPQNQAASKPQEKTKEGQEDVKKNLQRGGTSENTNQNINQQQNRSKQNNQNRPNQPRQNQNKNRPDFQKRENKENPEGGNNPNVNPQSESVKNDLSSPSTDAPIPNDRPQNNNNKKRFFNKNKNKK